ncbi:MAG: hypothetical protein ACRD4H_03735, partial [Candidatus Acidiferrales bacterium]
MQLGQLFIALGFDVDDKKLKEFREDLKGGLEGLLKISAAAGGAIYGIDRFIDGAISSAVALRNISLETGLATEAVQRLANVMAVADPSKGPLAYAQEIQKAQKILADARYAGTDIAAFAKLGITEFIGMNALQLHDALIGFAETHKKIFNDPAYTAELLDATGFHASEILAEADMPKSERDRIYNLPIGSKKDQDDLIKIARQLTELSISFETIRRQLTLEWGPGLITFIKKLDENLPEALKDIKEIGVAINSLGQFGWEKIAAGIGMLAAALGVISLPAAAFAASLAGIVFSLKEIGEYMAQPGHNWSTWFKDAGHVIVQGARDVGNYAANGAGSFETYLNDLAAQSEAARTGSYGRGSLLE